MNWKRLVILLIGGLLVFALITGFFTLAEPDSFYMSTDGKTQVVYNSAADQEKAEQLHVWMRLAQTLVVVVVAGLVVHGTLPGKWLRR